MLTFSGSLKVFVAVEPCDMRRSFDGLHNAVTNLLGEDPKSGAVFAFTNKRRLYVPPSSNHRGQPRALSENGPPSARRRKARAAGCTAAARPVE
ncbi:MAG: IS66 family insertion sequence element accessory protein TnpB [Verrucomicrobiae bacterium]|nr:IS66 family insertion sequence element accessory protein TnpB [Verrucomicrobiae bacterium]